jgi:hypothetical protein
MADADRVRALNGSLDTDEDMSSDGSSSSNSDSSSDSGSDADSDVEGYKVPDKGFIDVTVRDLNPYLTCKLCNGYFRDAHTTTECLHTCMVVAG